MVSLFDVTAEHGMTVSVSRQGVKLTRAAIGAVAIIEFPSFKHPLDVRHGVPPHSHSRATAQWQTKSYQNGTGEDRDVLPHPRNRRIRVLLAVVIAHDEARLLLLDHPRRREAACYAITSSALTIRVCGKVIPSAFAVLRFRTSLNFVGCSTGRSAGLAPLSILST